MSNIKSKRKSKRVSITSFEKIMKETHTPFIKIDWHGIEVTVKHTLSLSEVMSFVDSVTKSCFTDDRGVYLPEVKDFAIKCNILDMYANFALPANVERRYDLVYCTDAVESVLANINTAQYHEIVDAINDKIDNLAQANIEAVHSQMNELYTAFDGLQSQMSKIFDGVNVEDITKMVGAISGSSFDEEKLVQAFINQKKSVE